MEIKLLKGRKIVKTLVTPGIVRANEPNEIIIEIYKEEECKSIAY